MSRPVRLTDARALALHRRRAPRMPGGMADFLHRAAADEIQERLELVNRAFTDEAVISGYPDLWRSLRPAATLVADTEILDLAPESHDLVISGLVMHWCDDPVGHLVQIRRALKPDGLFLGILPGGRTLHELRAALAEAEVAETGGLSPRVAPMAEIRDLGSLLQRAALALPVADSLVLTGQYRDALHLMHDLRAMGETNALAARHTRTPPRSLFARAGALYAARHADAGGRIPATFELVVLTGWAPDPGQPRPLRPGSARARLADALGTQEHPLPRSRD